MVNPIKFGTGGWRTIIGEDFTKANIQVLAQALSDLMKEEGVESKGICIGYDRRFLSDRAARWFAEVVAGCGIKVYFINKVAPTPLIMFAVKSMGLPFGVAITASHNPAEFNGVKIFIEGGRDATVEVTDKLEKLSEPGHRPGMGWVWFPEGVKAGSIEITDPFNAYIDTILEMINIEAIKKRKLKVVFDPMFGVSKTSLLTVLVTARCEVEIIHDGHDTLFGGRMPSPTLSTLHQLRETVIEKTFDIGIGTDGDGDRLGIIDDKGSFIHPNNVLCLLYYYMLKYKGWKGPVVRNIATTHLLDKIAEGFGEKCYEVPVGFKHVSAKMEETDAVIGGESSGGLTIRGHIKGKDGIFAAALLIELMSVTGKSLSGLLAEINEQHGHFYMVERDCAFDEMRKAELQETLFTKRRLPPFSFTIGSVDYGDGLKVRFKNGGWLIARFSGTEPLLRIFAEMDLESEAARACDEMKRFLNL